MDLEEFSKNSKELMVWEKQDQANMEKATKHIIFVIVIYNLIFFNKFKFWVYNNQLTTICDFEAYNV